MWFIALTALALSGGTRESARRKRQVWTISDSVPTLVLPPKCGTTSVISFLNNCTSGLVNPKQKLCMQSRCSGTVVTHDGDIVHQHAVPSHGERVYGLIRHPVTRFISFLRYRLVGKGCRGDFARAGLCKHKTNVSHLVDSMTDADMLAFLPFRTLTAYVGAANNNTLLCTFEDFMLQVQQYYNFTHCPSAFPRLAPRSHNYPQDDAREDQRARIARVFHHDMLLWEEACKGRGRRHANIW